MNPLLLLKLKKVADKVEDFAAAIPDWVIITLAVVCGSTVFYCIGVQVEHERLTKAHQAQIARVNNAHALALSMQAEGTKKTLKEIRGNLDAARDLSKEKEVITKEVTKYVTKNADSQCTIPAGFVWMHDQTISGSYAELARSGPGDVDATTGVTLSTVAQVVGENNTECVKRGTLIEQWQLWYHKNKEYFENGQRIIQQAVDTK